MKQVFVVLMLLLVSPVYGGETTVPTQPAVAAPTSTQPTVAVPVEPAPVVDVVKVEGEKVTVNDIVTDAQEVASAVKAYKDMKTAGDKLAVRLGFMALLAAIFKILLSCVKFTSEFWKGQKGKIALRISTLVLGIGVTLLAHLAAGESWMNALLLGISGPMAIAFHELFDIIVELVQKTPEIKKKPA